MATRQINLLVIHCSATPNGRWTTADAVDRWHRERGFARTARARSSWNPDLTSIGYHWLIYPSGARATGRHVEEVGAHAAQWNARSIGICLIGTDRYTPAAWSAAADQVQHLASRHDVPIQFADIPRRGHAARGICGHRDLSPDGNGNGIVEPFEWLKTCPGFSVRDWISSGFVAPADHILEPAQ